MAIIVGTVLLAMVLVGTGPKGGHSSWTGQSDGIWLADYNSILVNETESSLGAHLHAGDGIAVVLTNSSRFPFYNTEAMTLHRQFPNLTLRGYSGLDGGMNRTGGLAQTIGGISMLYSQLSADYEVNGPLEFNPNGTAAQTYFSDFAAIVQASGRYAIGYPSGRGVLGDYSGSPDHWNYGKFATALDGMTIETQGYCGANLSSWVSATQKVWSEYNASHQNIATLSLQISLNPTGGGNGATVSQAIACATYWRAAAHGNLFFWWNGYESMMLQVLQALGR